MRSTTRFRLQSQTTRLVERSTLFRGENGPDKNAYGILTLYDVSFQRTCTLVAIAGDDRSKNYNSLRTPLRLP